MMKIAAWISVRRLVALVIALCVATHVNATPNRHATPLTRRSPVILDTDIGDDIDDTWALGLLLKSRELDLKLVVGDYGKTEYRAKLLAKFLEKSGRTDVAVGVGMKSGPDGEGGQSGWIKDYNLDRYLGKVHHDGVQAMIDTIMHSREPVTLICIGPTPNIAAALEREPAIARKVNVYSMAGSVGLGYGGGKTIAAEWNIKADVKSAQRFFAAPWKSMTITPLDTCGLVSLEGEQYQRMLSNSDPIAALVIENYRLWSKSNNADAKLRSSTLYDTVAVYLAIRSDLCRMEKLHVKVNDDGFTVIDPTARPMMVATSWKDLNGYREFLVRRLTGK